MVSRERRASRREKRIDYGRQTSADTGAQMLFYSDCHNQRAFYHVKMAREELYFSIDEETRLLRRVLQISSVLCHRRFGALIRLFLMFSFAD